jgi:hypothetical protein
MSFSTHTAQTITTAFASQSAYDELAALLANVTNLVVLTGVTATGATQANAYPLGAYRMAVEVLSVPASSGVLLPPAQVGSVVTIRNADGANALLIYPRSGGTINGGSANAPLSLAAGSSVTLWCSSSTNWYS